MGGLYELMGDFDKAEEMCMESLSIKRQLHDEDNLDVARIFQNLSQIKIRQNLYVDALRYIQQAYDIRF